MTWMTLNQGERELKEMKWVHDKSIREGPGRSSTADTRLLGKPIFLHKTIWTQTNTLSMPVLLALLSFRAIQDLRDHLVQLPHFLDKKTKTWKN